MIDLNMMRTGQPIEVENKWSFWEVYTDEDRKENFMDKLVEILKVVDQTDFIEMSAYSHCGKPSLLFSP